MNRELKVAYIAGVLDSDGWFTIHKNSKQTTNPIYSPKVGINQCEIEAIRVAQELFGSKIQIIDYSNQKRFSQRPMYHWSSNADTIESMLTELIPYLRIKVKQAHCLLRLVRDIRVNRRGGRDLQKPEVIKFRESLWKENRALNNNPVAETECVDASNGDATVRTVGMINQQMLAEMTNTLNKSNKQLGSQFITK